LVTIKQEGTKMDVKGLDDLLDSEQQTSIAFIPMSHRSLDFKYDTSGIVESVEELESNLENSNYLKEIPDFVMEDVEKTKFVLGPIGKMFGWKKTYIETIETQITKKSNLKEVIPKIVDDLTSVSNTLESYTKELRGVIKKRTSYIESLQKDVLGCVSEYNQLKVQRDDLVDELEKLDTYKMEMEQYLSTHDHCHEDFCENEMRNVSLLKRCIDVENDIELTNHRIKSRETLKYCLEKKMGDANRDNLGMELYVSYSDNARTLIEHQKNECSIMGASFYILASDIKQIAKLGMDMARVSNVNEGMIGSLKSLLNREYFSRAS
ncbi:hypothetical protein KY321_03140, partial [Candidatus Woesearchaeota archaeon]|nr:hypothetical protein [Candidatus Woesearchaeota archaeon]